MILVAEVKTQSPYGFKSDKTWDYLFDLANEYGDVISIHTDPRFGGSFKLLERARGKTNKPILAKGEHRVNLDIEKAIKIGANYVLVVGRIPEVYQDKCIIEPYSLQELRNIPEGFKVVWNSRDLRDGSRKKESFDEARKIRKGWMCQASNIKSKKDVNSLADAILVGSYLEEFIKCL